MSQQYTTMSLEAIKLLCSVINKTVDLPNTVISDTSIATNTTYSSHKLDKEFTTLEDELKHYTDTAIAGLNKLTKEIINDKSLVVKDNVLYLYKAADDPSNDYMQMMLINGVAVELGSTQVDMTDYYNKTDSDNKFAAKLDLDTLTTSFNDLKTVIGDTSLLKNATLMEDVQELYTELDDKMVKVNGDVLEYIKNNPQKNLTVFWNTTNTNTPYSDGFTGSGEGVLISNVCDDRWGSVIGTCGGDYFCINRLMGGTWQGWEKMCTASVVDVAKTLIISEDTNVELNSSCIYTVVNGVCYVTLWGFKATATGQFIVNNSMPKTKTTSQGMCSYGRSGGIGACAFIYDDGSDKSKLYIEVNMVNESLYGSFSYPVA